MPREQRLLKVGDLTISEIDWPPLNGGSRDYRVEMKLMPKVVRELASAILDRCSLSIGQFSILAVKMVIPHEMAWTEDEPVPVAIEFNLTDDSFSFPHPVVTKLYPGSDSGQFVVNI